MTETPKNKGGRPKGLGKVPGSGRRKSVPDSTRAQTLDRINQEADPIGFLIRVARGLKYEGPAAPGAPEYPTREMQMDACKILARKVVPDQKAVEITPGGAEPFVFQFISPLQAGNA